MSVFTNHSEIDDIEMAIHLLRIYSSTDEKEIFEPKIMFFVDKIVWKMWITQAKIVKKEAEHSVCG